MCRRAALSDSIGRRSLGMALAGTKPSFLARRWDGSCWREQPLQLCKSATLDQPRWAVSGLSPNSPVPETPDSRDYR